ncbi:hypothetical protein [Vogesella sp. LIG4]|uniref:hypothetical protein n=1 Tax=Vogesella sp. LIG4 TaxID=1192162 RepID=UPI0012FDF29C|nr:hypothetical protein [Vogesella sp. LIG4]
MAELKEAGILALSDSLLAAMGFIDVLRERGTSKVACLRLDLLVEGMATREQVDACLTHLRLEARWQQGVFAHCLGLIRTPPIQEEGQYRIQCVLLFDGEQVRRDIQCGDEVGRYWANIITEGQGRYVNYNRYRQMDLSSGCGVISLTTMRWKCHSLLLSMGSAAHPLIIAGVPCRKQDGD